MAAASGVAKQRSSSRRRARRAAAVAAARRRVVLMRSGGRAGGVAGSAGRVRMAEEAMVRVWEACVVKREALRRKVSSVGVIVPLEISSRVFSNSHIDLVDVLGHGGRPEVLLVGLGHVERKRFVLVGVLMYCKWARERGEGERGGHVWLARTWRACRGSSRGRRGSSPGVWDDRSIKVGAGVNRVDASAQLFQNRAHARLVHNRVQCPSQRLAWTLEKHLEQFRDLV